MERNMKKYDEFIEGLQDIEIPEEVFEKFEDTLNNLPGLPEQKRNVWSKWRKAAAGAAAVLIFGTGFCYANPALAAKIPIIGKIFERVEEKVTFSGEYKDKAQILTTEMESTSETEVTDTKYTATDGGVKITASEVYCDGYSIYLTARIQTDEGGMTKMPEFYTSTFMNEKGTAAQNIYTKGSWFLEGEGISESLDLNSFEGEAVDDHTFVGLLKLDLQTQINQDGVLQLELAQIGYDNIEDADSDDNGASHRTEGNWKFSIPYRVDLEHTKEITVDQNAKNGYGIQKIFLSPYQLVVYSQVPYTTLTEEEFTREDFENGWREKGIDTADGGTLPVTYEEMLEEKQYEYSEISVFNQDGSYLLPKNWDNEKAVFAVKGMDISKLSIFMSNEPGAIIKEEDMNIAKEKSMFSAEVDVE